MHAPDPLPFALPDITEDEIEAVVRVLRSRWLTTGAEARAFEAEFASAVGAPHAVALSSATAALHLSLEALGIGPGDLVFVPTYTFAASAEVVRYLGATPVLCDVESASLNIDARDLRLRVERARALGDGRPRAVIPVHVAGVAADLEEIWDLAREFGLAVVEDAAHAFPATYRGRPVGWMPEDVRGTACYSFYATKTITTGEGGMLVTRDAALAERARLMSLHGLSRQAWNRYSGGTWKYDITAPGYKYNLTDIAAAMGRVQLSRAQEMSEARASIARRYQQGLAELRSLVLPGVPEGRESAWHLYVLRLAPGHGGGRRDQLIDALTQRGIGVSMHFIPLHLHSYYRETFGYRPEDLPVAYEESLRGLSLPIWSAMADDDVDRVIRIVRDVVPHVLGEAS